MECVGFAFECVAVDLEMDLCAFLSGFLRASELRRHLHSIFEFVLMLICIGDKLFSRRLRSVQHAMVSISDCVT